LKRQAVENLSVFFDGDVRVDGNALKRQESESLSKSAA